MGSTSAVPRRPREGRVPRPRSPGKAEPPNQAAYLVRPEVLQHLEDVGLRGGVARAGSLVDKRAVRGLPQWVPGGLQGSRTHPEALASHDGRLAIVDYVGDVRLHGPRRPARTQPVATGYLRILLGAPGKIRTCDNPP